MTNIGIMIKSYLNENGITAKEFAEEIGVTESAMSRYINGSRFPSDVKLEKIKEIIGIEGTSKKKKDDVTTEELESDFYDYILENDDIVRDFHREFMNMPKSFQILIIKNLMEITK